jgi:hypothetical protein
MLAQHNGKFSLNGLTPLSGEAAEALSRLKCHLLHGLATLSNEAAKSLAKRKSGLFLEGLTTLSNEAAGALRANLLVSIPDSFEH